MKFVQMELYLSWLIGQRKLNILVVVNNILIDGRDVTGDSAFCVYGGKSIEILNKAAKMANIYVH